MTSPAQREFEAHTLKIIEEYEKSPTAEKKDWLAKKPNGNYTDKAIYAAWQGWQAALASHDKLRDAVIVLEDGAEPEVGDEYIMPIYSKGSSNRYIKGYRSLWFHKKKYHGCQLHGDRIGELYCFASVPDMVGYANVEISVRDGQSVIEVLGRPVKRNNKPVIYRSEL